MGKLDSCDAGDRPAQKFFISYRRSAGDDRSLASYLKAGPEQAGHEVFIDFGMAVGTDWAADRMVRSSDRAAVRTLDRQRDGPG